MCDEQYVTQIAEEIHEYLKEHPKASDTLEGIAHWWLAKQFIAKHLQLVEFALEDLIKRGVVDALENEKSGTLYYLKKTMI